MKKLLLITCLLFSVGLVNASTEEVKKDFQVEDSYAEIVYDLQSEALTVYKKTENNELQSLVVSSLEDYSYETNIKIDGIDFDLFVVGKETLIARTHFEDYAYAFCFKHKTDFIKVGKQGKVLSLSSQENLNSLSYLRSPNWHSKNIAERITKNRQRKIVLKPKRSTRKFS